MSADAPMVGRVWISVRIRFAASSALDSRAKSIS